LITSETSVAKLMWALGKTNKLEEVRKIMLTTINVDSKPKIRCL
jgi:L-asparaginase/Glu-tRNA(Gln) amidotransferase subunit D